jgi:hypothetical protein
MCNRYSPAYKEAIEAQWQLKACQNRHMIGGKHLQRGTNRLLTYNAFFTEEGPIVSIMAIIREGDRLLETPDLELVYRAADGALEDAVIARLVRYMNDTTFGVGTPRRPFLNPDFMPFGRPF